MAALRGPSLSWIRPPIRPRAQAAAYRTADDLKALMVRNINTMLGQTTAASGQEPDTYLNRSQLNATLVKRFADEPMMHIYQQFVAGPLSAACAARNRELGLAPGSRGFARQTFVFAYEGRLHSVVLG